MATTKTQSVYQKLSEARKVISETKMEKKGENKFSKYKYFTPDQVHKLVETACQSVGLLTLFNLKRNELGYYGELILIDTESERDITFTFVTDVPEIKATNASQKLGGMMTYTERYAKSSVFGIVDNNLDFDSQDNRVKTLPSTPKTPAPKTEEEKEELFKGLIVKEKGMTDVVKGVIKRSTWDAAKMFKLIEDSGNKTITKEQVDAANV
jgi:hypothetical protein